ncbi:allatostatin-A receptor [Patella vulgata]|uniref:allatostatin-A receptor n=1 Tax=Patella vulgata TaxID=6465 RepID=UPI0021807B06|nr:allatostatin-A receptor [Patella vulgata]
MEEMTTQIANSTNVTKNDHYDLFNDVYGYEYDYEESVNNIPLDELIPASITYSLTLLIGVIGNTLVIFSISYYKRMRSTTNVFLLSLACADLLLVLVCVPIKFAAFFAFTWGFGEFLCKFVHYMQNVSMICSVMTLTAMSVEKFIAIKYPLQAKSVCTMRNTQIIVCIIWLVSFIMAIPIVFGRIHKEVGFVRKAYWCIQEWSKQSYAIAYEMYMFFILFLLPVGVMTVTYMFICVEIWRLASVRASMRTGRVISPGVYMMANQSMAGENSEASVPLKGRPAVRRGQPQSFKKTPSDNTRRQVVIMLMVVVFLFTICWAPILFNNLLVAFGYLEELHIGYLKPMRMAFFLLSYVNSCVNPIVYAFLSKNFRQSFIFAICACIKGRAFVRAYTFSRSVVTRTSTIHTQNGRSKLSSEKDTNTAMLSETTAQSPQEDMELKKI